MPLVLPRNEICGVMFLYISIVLKKTTTRSVERRIDHRVRGVVIASRKAALRDDLNHRALALLYFFSQRVRLEVQEFKNSFISFAEFKVRQLGHRILDAPSLLHDPVSGRH